MDERRAGVDRRHAPLGQRTRLRVPGRRHACGPCGRVFAGALGAAGSGYSSDAQRLRPWFAIEPEAFVDRSIVGWVRCRVAAGAVVPLHAETFSVAGVGQAYDTPPIGALVSLSLEVVTP